MTCILIPLLIDPVYNGFAERAGRQSRHKRVGVDVGRGAREVPSFQKGRLLSHCFKSMPVPRWKHGIVSQLRIAIPSAQVSLGSIKIKLEEPE